MSFRINRVYTRSGDDGSTSLVGGARVPKSHPRLEVVGTLDELNCTLGVVREHLCEQTSQLLPVVEHLQQELFDLGSELATPVAGQYEGMWKVTEEQSAVLEGLCDKYRAELPELHSFVLPGGSRLASFLHMSRSVCRRAERELLRLEESPIEQHPVSAEVKRYVNRLSDLLFILSRWALKAEGKPEVLWKKGEKRESPL